MKLVDLRDAHFTSLVLNFGELEGSGTAIFAGDSALFNDMRSATYQILESAIPEPDKSKSMPASVEIPDIRKISAAPHLVAFEGIDELKQTETASEKKLIEDFEGSAKATSLKEDMTNLVALSENTTNFWSVANFRKERAIALVQVLKSHPYALETFVARYADPLPDGGNTADLNTGWFISSALAFGDGGYGGGCCGSDVAQGDPNFDVREFATLLYAEDVYRQVDDETRKQLDLWRRQ